MRLCLILAGAMLAAALAGCAGIRDGESSLVLVRAQGYTPTVKYTDTYPAEWDAGVPPDQRGVVLGGYFIGRFHIHEVLGGELKRERLTVKLSMADMYIRMPDMFMVLKIKPGGEALALWWERADEGFCVSPQTFGEVGFEIQAAAAQQKYPCRNDND